MALYEIDEHEVLLAIRQGNRQVLPDGKLSFIFKVNHKFRYPLKVVAVEKPDSLTIVTAYPLKKAR
jgi:hypothetical protein